MYIFIGIGEKAESTIYYLRSTSRSSTTDPETFKGGEPRLQGRGSRLGSLWEGSSLTGKTPRLVSELVELLGSEGLVSEHRNSSSRLFGGSWHLEDKKSLPFGSGPFEMSGGPTVVRIGPEV